MKRFELAELAWKQTKALDETTRPVIFIDDRPVEWDEFDFNIPARPDFFLTYDKSSIVPQCRIKLTSGQIINVATENWHLTVSDNRPPRFDFFVG